MIRIASLLVVCVALLTACGGGNDPAPPTNADPVEQVPDSSGEREAVREAQAPDVTSFPSAKGKTLEEVAGLVTSGPDAAVAGSVYTKGENRFAFGIIGSDGKPIYGPSAIYVAPAPDQPAQGPFAAPADVLLTQARYRSKQAATENDPFAAIYAAQVKFSNPGTWAVLVMTRSGGRLVGAPMRIQVKTKAQDTIPDVGEAAPKVETDTLESLKGNKDLLDTRDPKTDMHENFAKVVGTKPVALLFSTPQLCTSRVCGPVTDIALQMRAKYGKRMTFIHQEVWTNNQLNSALRPPLQAFHVQTEPWLFVVDKTGKITARLEGSFGVGAFEKAVKSGL